MALNDVFDAMMMWHESGLGFHVCMWRDVGRKRGCCAYFVRRKLCEAWAGDIWYFSGLLNVGLSFFGYCPCCCSGGDDELDWDGAEETKLK
jgi:hypothetical protein